ncbi:MULTISPECIES: S8 family peptidase [unclassified Mesorhizobium]|uniref:S8 family peptidase n=1 Tax=unclassified Mesorhizobium TaxID=325217 RepID=UPI00040E28B6|nr:MULTISPECIES: S8 family peptidase [unclassified Mesorhizobium]WJI71383.1 S8 family peptidase [Mesorhizobium sp. C399B]
MPIDKRPSQPLLNPVLALTKEPVPESPAVGGQGEAGVVAERLDGQRTALARDIEALTRDVESYPKHGGKIQIVASMFRDSFAPTWTPKALFDLRFGCTLTGPVSGGYLVEADVKKIGAFASFVRSASSIEARTAISRVRSIKPFGEKDILRGNTIESLWKEADDVDGGKAFIIWLAPFRDENARASVIETLSRIENQSLILPTYSRVDLPSPDGDADAEGIAVVMSNDQTAIRRAARRYRNDGAARAYVRVPNRSSLRELVASGASYRIDPVRRVEVTAPNVGSEPGPPLPTPATQPVVAVVDGGLTARSYLALEAWRAPPLVVNRVADHVHGNRISSLVVQAFAWNNQLNLPEIECRIGTVQAIPRAGGNSSTNTEMLIDYLRQVARRFPDAKVWNMSFNQTIPEDDLEVVSYLGHEIRQIAREFNILPVISIGNQHPDNPKKQLCPPADCEAALTVAGRKFDGRGMPSGPCQVSLVGPGPDGMLKPDLSWYSTLNMVGGGPPQSGSSYAVPLVSSLAAHTYANLKEPSPDLVRALLINKAELEAHETTRGWGTPFHGNMPWICEPGSVTMAWRAALIPGYAYYWNDIPIPPELISAGNLFGRARLTAILNPVVSQLGGPNYFATRLQVALQYKKASGGVGNLLGSMREDKDPEETARSELAKWHPVRRHSRDFSRRGGLTYSGNVMRLHARVFARDLFQFGLSNHRELGEQEVAFVLTLSGRSPNSAIYNSTAQRLRNFVESAVIGQEIDVGVGN